MVGWLLQKAADRADARYQPKAGQTRQGRATIGVQGIFGSFQLARDYDCHPGKDQGHYPAAAALGLEVGYTPALTKRNCLEGAAEPTHMKAERHLAQTGGLAVSARQMQRVIQRVGTGAQLWQARPGPAGACDAPIVYVNAAGTGGPMVAQELNGRRASNPTARPGRAKSTWVVSAPSTAPMKKAILCGTMRRRLMFRVSHRSLSSVHYCGGRRLAAGWAMPTE